MAPQDLGRPDQVLVGAAGAPGDDPLVHLELAIHDLPGEGGCVFGAQLLSRVHVHLVEQIGQVGLELPDGVGIGGVEGQGDHGLHGGEVHLDEGVIVGALPGGLGLELVPPAQALQVVFGDAVGGPHRREAGGLGGHDVDAGAVVHGEAGHAGAEELHHGILHDALLEGGPDEGQGHILGPGAGPGGPGEIDGDDLGIGDVIGLLEELPGQLGPALSDGHGAVGAVAGVGVRAQDHPAGGGVPLPHVGVDDGLVGGDELAAVFPGGREAEDVVILVDGAAHGAQGVVAVGEHIGQGEGLHARGPGSLDDTHIGDVMGGHGVEFQGQPLQAGGGVVGLQNGPGHGASPL